MSEGKAMEALFDQVHNRLTRIEEKLDDVLEFKAKVGVTSRITSIVVSAILGFFSVVSSSVLAYVITTKLHK